MDTMEKLREQIDRIDKELVALFEERMEVSRQIARYKVKNNLPITDKAREKEVIAKNMLYLKDPTLGQKLEEFFAVIIKLSKAVQEEVKK